MILIISICREKLHYREFVKPIEDILKKEGIEYRTIYYKKITDKELLNKKTEKIIVCGTSLQDNEYLGNLGYFKWINIPKFEKPILGICGGMQIIQLISGGELMQKTEIGFYEEDFTGDFLGIKKGKQQVYHLHNNYVTLPKDFQEFTASEIPQAIKHKTKNIYGVLFHPEVRNKEMILEFCKK